MGMTLALAGDAALAAHVCDHDGKASGRLVLETGGVRREIVCECGHVIRRLGSQRYEVDVGAARQRPSRARWRRLRLMLLSPRGGRPRAALGTLDLPSEPDALGALRAAL